VIQRDPAMLLCVLRLLALLSAAHAFQLGTRGWQSQQMRRVTTAKASIEAPPPPGFVWADFGEDASPPGAPAVAATAAPVAPSAVIIEKDAKSVGASLWKRVQAAAEKAIAERGHFALAIPGGSVLKMLGDTSPAWAASTTLAYVNHKCVAMDDKSLATHAKACDGFLDQWAGVNAIVLEGSDNAPVEASAYEDKLRALPGSALPRDAASGMPLFDMMLIGVGDDGHVGSLYPGRSEVLDESGRWVLPVEMKTPGSITLSLPVMAGAREVVIAACGVSEKYPMGKSEAMARAIEGDETPPSFPAVGLRGTATWILDQAAASTLSVDYAESFALTMSRGDCSPPE